MEDKLTNKEKQLKHIADDFSIEMNTGDLWDAIEDKLPPTRKKRKFAMWWLFPAGIAFMAIGALIQNYVSSNTNSGLIVENVHKNSDQQDTELKVSTTQIDKITQNTHSTISNTPENEEVNTFYTPNKTALSKTKAPQLENINTRTNIPIAPRYDDEYSYPKTVNEEKVEQDSKFNPFLIPPTVTKSDEINNDQTNNFIDESLNKSIASIDRLASRSIEFPKREFTIGPKSFTTPISTVRWAPFYQFASGVALNNPRKQTSNNSEGIDFGREQGLPGINTTLGYGLESTNGWQFSIGLNHSFIASRYINTDQTIVQEEVDGESTLLIDEDGNITPLNGTLTKTTIYNNDITWHRLQHYVDIQASVGYQFWRSGKWSLTARTDLGYNLWSRHDGYAITNTGILKFTNSDDHPFENQGISTAWSMSLQYNFDKVSIGIQPFTRHSLSSTLKTDYSYSLKNSQYGIQLSALYRP